MTKTRKTFRNVAICAVAACMAGTLVASQLVPSSGRSTDSAVANAEGEMITDISGKVKTDLRSHYNSEVVKKLPEGLDGDREISVIVKTADEGLLSAYSAQSGISRYSEIADFADSKTGSTVVSQISRANELALSRIRSAGVSYTKGATYDTLMGGFELVVKARDYLTISDVLEGTGAEAHISEEYQPAEAKFVENVVNVYDTGIFDSSDSEYDGTGTLVAVLDTGLDYKHAVFDPALFHVAQSDLALTRSNLASVIGNLRAATTTRGLSVNDVYVNDKVPFMYDYADQDPDAYPISEQHGTHVSGIILGRNVDTDGTRSQYMQSGDDVIIGVAPNAQLASMKVFSNKDSGARQAWILAALEDCIMLNVDVINMSLGSSVGFSVDDDAYTVDLYNRIEEAGISLVVAAGNDFNSTYASDKNGNLGLTSNPDSSTVGSPSTYEAALSVASISGVKTPYLKYGNTIMYFTEASDVAAQPKEFVKDLFANPTFQSMYGQRDSIEIEYVTIPGTGGYGDYSGYDVKGKIALVSRGSNTFEEKAQIAEQMGAVGIIIYNNVSGDIAMSVGTVSIAACSISQDNGKILSANSTGKITISKSQVAGPFISDFSSWGPTPDLRIKPEITAHGGEILSAVPGQGYDRLSGTSMASPNQAGVTALVRQYVMEHFGLSSDDTATRRKVASLVNQIMMSTADIAYNINGLPYSVRKQGAGLANLAAATSTPAYITTYERNDAALRSEGSRFLVDSEHVMTKTKIEYGDDPARTGSYELVFALNNTTANALTYNIGAIVMTEGVSETKTLRGDTTVTEEGYLLDPAFSVTDVSGGTAKGEKVTIPANGAATVTVLIELSAADKEYLDRSFENGMYVEGYITATPQNKDDVSLNVPFLAFYGDWTAAPLFDLDYFETETDAMNGALNPEDTRMADSVASRPIGGLYDDYIAYLGSYSFETDPSLTPIAPSRDHISLSNQEDSVNSLLAIWAGMLRGARHIVITITDTTTGEEIWRKDSIYNQHKSFNNSGSIVDSSIDVGFNVADHDLKNNTKYLVRVEGFLDYAEESDQRNVRNVIEFPFVTDFEAPVLTDCDFYTEYDRSTQKTKFFARLHVYDNHYAMGMSVGQVYWDSALEGGGFVMSGFGRYPTPVYSNFNSTSEVVFELTDYIDELARSSIPNSFTVSIQDYAGNEGTYEVKIPDSVRKVYFDPKNSNNKITYPDENSDEPLLTLSPNETFVLNPEVYPAGEWASTLRYEVADGNEALRIVNGKVLALASVEEAYINICSADGTQIGRIKVHVLNEEDPGFTRIDPPTVDVFNLTGYMTDKAFYFQSYLDRDIGAQGYSRLFAGVYALSMYPSEQVTLEHELIAFVDESEVEIEYLSGNEMVVTVDENGTIIAVAEGVSTVSVTVYINGRPCAYQTITIEVKNPYERLGQSLTNYFGLGGTVDIGKDLGPAHGLTEIGSYAFSHYIFIPKDLAAGDVIDEEDPYNVKITYAGENQDVEEVIIPEGVETISAYAFAGMKGLRRVQLPSTLKKIQTGAFYDCTSLEDVDGLENVQFINQNAFQNTALESVALDSVIAIGEYAFANTKLFEVTLPRTLGSIGAYAFANSSIFRVNIHASEFTLGEGAFCGCTGLYSVTAINSASIPARLFDGCTSLVSVSLGADVNLIDRSAFAHTSTRLTVSIDPENPYFSAADDGKSFLNAEGDELLFVLPSTTGAFTLPNVTKIGANAFTSSSVTSVNMPDVTEVGANAFYDCGNITSVSLGALTSIGEYAFYGCGLRAMPNIAGVKEIPVYAFYGTSVTSVTIPEGAKVGANAFAHCERLQRVEIGANAEIGNNAFVAYHELRLSPLPISGHDGFYYATVSSVTSLSTVTAGAGVTIGDNAFAYSSSLSRVTLGTGTKIGNYAFYGDGWLTSIDLSQVTTIGDYAFAGYLNPVYYIASDGTEEYAGTYDGTFGAVTVVNLSAAESVGAHAFEYGSVRSLTLGSDLTKIAPYAFYGNTYLTSVDLSGVTEVGEEAFGLCSLSGTLDLSDADVIGAYAFESTPISAVTFKEGVQVGDSAFLACESLAAADLENVATFGSYAFAGTALAGEIDLENAEYIGDFAFLETDIDSVLFGEKLLDVGENPFAGNILAPFYLEEGETFGGKPTGETHYITSYNIGENLSVIDGVLYRKIWKANGDFLGTHTVEGATVSETYSYELVVYPALREGDEYAVEEGTIRVSPWAFSNSSLVRVTLPASLLALGDKAFYGCEDLAIVTFLSYNAPILEEQYNEDLYYDNNNATLTDENGEEYFWLPPSGVLVDVDTETGESTYIPGLGIVKYTMWNLNPTTFFYGATFGDYIGFASGDIVMVRPKNGLNYDSFTMEQYFGPVIDGNAAPDDLTLSVIRGIRQLPEAVDINESNVDEIEARVVALRAAYETISSAEQQALVENLNRLIAAENTIAYIKGNDEPTVPTDPETEGDSVKTALIAVCAVLGAALVAVSVMLYVVTRKRGGSKKEKDDLENDNDNE